MSSAELYSPTTGSFTLLTATMAFAREFHTATLLNDGQVLIAGGAASTAAASTPPTYEELYDPSTQTFLRTGALNAPRIAHNALLLGNGTVLIVGGEAPNDLTGLFGQSFPPQATSEAVQPRDRRIYLHGEHEFLARRIHSHRTGERQHSGRGRRRDYIVSGTRGNLHSDLDLSDSRFHRGDAYFALDHSGRNGIVHGHGYLQ